MLRLLIFIMILNAGFLSCALSPRLSFNIFPREDCNDYIKDSIKETVLTKGLIDSVLQTLQEKLGDSIWSPLHFAATRELIMDSIKPPVQLFAVYSTANCSLRRQSVNYRLDTLGILSRVLGVSKGEVYYAVKLPNFSVEVFPSGHVSFGDSFHNMYCDKSSTRKRLDFDYEERLVSEYEDGYLKEVKYYARNYKDLDSVITYYPNGQLEMRDIFAGVDAMVAYYKDGTKKKELRCPEKCEEQGSVLFRFCDYYEWRKNGKLKRSYSGYARLCN